MISWSMKQRDGKGWRLLGRDEVCGVTIRDALSAASGSETVVELKLPATGSTWYVCGTDSLAARMRIKGKGAVTCQAAIGLIDASCPGMLDQIDSKYQGPEEEKRVVLFHD